MKNCLVLGADGFIGSHIAERLIQKGYNVICFDKFNNNKIKNIQFLKSKAQIVNGDFFNSKTLNKVLRGVDYVFHFISICTPHTSFENKWDEIKYQNGTLKLFELCKKHNIKKIVFPSSGGTIYGNLNNKKSFSETDQPNPKTPYAIVRSVIEDFLIFFNQIYGIKCCILRISNVYGPRCPIHGDQNVVGIFLNQLMKNKRPIIFGNGKSIRDFIHVKDVAEAAVICIENKTKEMIYNIGTEKGYSVLDVLRILSNLTKKKIKPIFKKERHSDLQKVVLDCTKFKEEFQWKPKYNLNKGLKETYDWIKNTN